MSVDKAKDTPPKKPTTDNEIVEAKPESSTETENKPDATPKKGKVWARVRSQYPKPTRTTGTTFLERRKRDSTSSRLRGDLCSCGSFSVVGRWRWAGTGCQCSYH